MYIAQYTYQDQGEESKHLKIHIFEKSYYY